MGMLEKLKGQLGLSLSIQAFNPPKTQQVYALTFHRVDKPCGKDLPYPLSQYVTDLEEDSFCGLLVNAWVPQGSFLG